MADRAKFAFIKNALSQTGGNPQEQTALEDLLFSRLLTAGFTVNGTGQFSWTQRMFLGENLVMNGGSFDDGSGHPTTPDQNGVLIKFPLINGETGSAIALVAGGPTPGLLAVTGLSARVWGSNAHTGSSVSGNANGGHVEIWGGDPVGTGVLGYVHLTPHVGIGQPPETAEILEIFHPTSPSLIVARDNGGGTGVVNQFLRFAIDGAGTTSYIDSSHYTSGGYAFELRVRGTAAITMSTAQKVQFNSYSSGTATFTAGAKYVVVDATGNLLVSAVGPAS